MRPEVGLAGLFLSSFLAATLLPGGSEAVLFAVLRLHPHQAAAALALATLGNTLGGMTTYGMGRLLPQRLAARPLALARRWGTPVLVLAWAPVVGDLFCAAAGWLRLPLLGSTLWMAAGKAARYAVVLWLALGTAAGLGVFGI
ncbi:MAG: DedA family protein [Rhodocyclaceae bacterium]|nr:DedA family protein [Rhodocyclaceae bacterium]